VAQVIITAVIVMVVGDVLMRCYYARKVLKIFETKPPFNLPLYPEQPQAERVEFPTTHGLTLRGSLYRAVDKPAQGLVVFFPELDGTHWSALSYCESLVAAGFDLLAFDFRNQGDSDPQADYSPLHWATMYEIDDSRAAMRYVQSREDLNDLPLGLMGISRGSTMALAMGAEFPEVRAVCCEGGYSTDSLCLYFILHWAFIYVPGWAMRILPRWHFRSTLTIARWASQRRRNCRYALLERWLPRLRGKPVLFIAGERDNYVHPEIGRKLCRKIGGSAEMWIVPKAKHNRAREAAPQDYDRRLVEFFTAKVLAPSELHAVRCAADSVSTQAG
jgi:uncharacterized protein